VNHQGRCGDLVKPPADQLTSPASAWFTTLAAISLVRSTIRSTSARTCASSKFHWPALDLGTGDLTYANAGHPPPTVITGTGQAEYLDDTTGTMLGACTDTTFTTGLRRLSPGNGLLCYTDGLIEDRHRDITKGFLLLAEALRLSAPFSAEHMCAIVEAALLGAAHRADDVCLLAAHLTG
jgi:Stage II sporulation protein E (SpoIIE)